MLAFPMNFIKSFIILQYQIWFYVNWSVFCFVMENSIHNLWIQHWIDLLVEKWLIFLLSTRKRFIKLHTVNIVNITCYLLIFRLKEMFENAEKKISLKFLKARCLEAYFYSRSLPHSPSKCQNLSEMERIHCI